MKIMEINGGKELNGTIRVSGAKNASVAIIPAAILSDEEVTICNVPEITDTNALCDILKELNVDVKRASESIVINPSNMENLEIEEEYSKEKLKEVNQNLLKKINKLEWIIAILVSILFSIGYLFLLKLCIWWLL